MYIATSSPPFSIRHGSTTSRCSCCVQFHIAVLGLTAYSSLRIGLCMLQLRRAICATDSRNAGSTSSHIGSTETYLDGLFHATKETADVFERFIRRGDLRWLPHSVAIGCSAIPLSLCSLSSRFMDFHTRLRGVSTLANDSEQRLLVTLMQVMQTFDRGGDGIDSLSKVINYALQQISLHVSSHKTCSFALQSKRDATLPISTPASLHPLIPSSCLVMASAINACLRSDMAAGSAEVSMGLVATSERKTSKSCHDDSNGPQDSRSVCTHPAGSAAQITSADLERWIANDRSLHFACAMDLGSAESQTCSTGSPLHTNVALDWQYSPLDEGEASIDGGSIFASSQIECDGSLDLLFDGSRQSDGCDAFQDYLALFGT